MLLAQVFEAVLSAPHRLFGLLAVLPWLGLIASCFALFAPQRSRDGSLSAIILLTQILPFVVLVTALAMRATELALVWATVGEDLPLIYRVSGAWASREGPLLMWAAMLSFLSWWYRQRTTFNMQKAPLIESVTCLLFLVSIGMEPFSLSTEYMRQSVPAEMNPLLQTSLMAIHPPIIFVFYSLTLLTAQLDLCCVGEPESSLRGYGHRAALISFIVGTVGIGLGGLWAFTVLDWGGYWAWDPVETGSLLPWLIIAIRLHAPHSSLFRSVIIQRSCATVLVGSTFFATLVTRAGGVWASVHAFVGSTGDTPSSDGLQRLLSVSFDTVAGAEIMAYLSVLTLVLGHLLAAMLETPSLPRRHWFNAMSPALVSLIFGPTAAVLMLAVMAILLLRWITLHAEKILQFNIESGSVMVMILVSIVATFGPSSEPSPEVWSWWMDGLLLICLIIPLIVHAYYSGRSREITRWSIVLLLLLGTWVGLAGVPTAALLIIVALVPWVLEDAADSIADSKPRLNISRFVRTFAPVLGAIYFTMTLFVLFASMDVPQFGLHEVLGAPLLVLALLGLPLAHGVGKIDARRVAVVASIAFGSTLIGGLLFMDVLPGDAHLALAGAGITRGVIAILLLPPLLLAIPGLLIPMWSAVGQVRMKASAVRVRRFGTVVIHFGLVLLLLGHVFSTTLVARGDLGHVVSVTQDVPVIVGGRAYTLDSFEVIPATDDEYDSKVGAGDGYIGLNLKVVDTTSFDQTSMTPGVIRFDDSMMTRSEVSRAMTASGVTIAILDAQQASDLMLKMEAGEGVDRVRVTIYDLPLNHLVWLGWLLMVGGSLVVLTTTPRVGAKEEE